MAATKTSKHPNITSKIVINIGSRKSVAAAKKQVEAIQNRYKDTDAMLMEFSKRIEKEYMKPMLRKLKNEVPTKRRYPSDYPLEFTSEKQRRYVMWKLNGKPYKRSHELERGWFYRVNQKSGKITITIGNDKKYSKFVVGKFGLGFSSRQKRRYVEPQQKFHQVTGWLPAHKTVQKYLIKAKNASTTLVNQWIAEGKI